MNLFAWFAPKKHVYSLLPGDNESKGSSMHISTRWSFWNLLLKMALVGLLIVSGFFAGRLSISVPNTETNEAFGCESDQITYHS